MLWCQTYTIITLPVLFIVYRFTSTPSSPLSHTMPPVEPPVGWWNQYLLRSDTDHRARPVRASVPSGALPADRAGRVGVRPPHRQSLRSQQGPAAGLSAAVPAVAFSSRRQVLRPSGPSFVARIPAAPRPPRAPLSTGSRVAVPPAVAAGRAAALRLLVHLLPDLRVVWVASSAIPSAIRPAPPLVLPPRALPPPPSHYPLLHRCAVLPAALVGALPCQPRPRGCGAGRVARPASSLGPATPGLSPL